ncbi:hypothetical protein BX600DRAFT_517558 [Xylariales sp. PMI_506]|nr:hypothetical protein BX600DRAFT_517558 [Xylariales sp. PMI_506]
MADARSLLRAHRAANRIEHPQALYSDAGKLLCRICRETIKSETLWDAHIRGSAHRQRVASSQAALVAAAGTVVEPSNKRKLDDVEAMDVVEDDDDAALLRSKKTKTETSPATPTPAPAASMLGDKGTTPPGLVRRPSSTPAQGVEISIPSRPATPLVGEGSATSTPNLPSLGRSPLIGTGFDYAGTPSTIGSQALSQPAGTATADAAATQTTAANGAAGVDEAEWAAFEAEIAASDVPPAATATGDAYADATISAAALTADEAAAKSLEEENERRKHLLDTQIADEQEDAQRALEDEFDEMEELESRVHRLKERREELRKQSIANLRGAAASGAAATAAISSKPTAPAPGKENAGAALNGDDADSDEDDEADEDWDDGFRFRA